MFKKLAQIALSGYLALAPINVTAAPLSPRFQHKNLQELIENPAEMENYHVYGHDDRRVSHYDSSLTPEEEDLGIKFAVYMKPSGDLDSYLFIFPSDSLNKTQKRSVKYIERLTNLGDNSLANRLANIERNRERIRQILDDNGFNSEEILEKVIEQFTHYKEVWEDDAPELDFEFVSWDEIKNEDIENMNPEMEAYLSRTVDDNEFYRSEVEDNRDNFFERAEELGYSKQDLREFDIRETFDFLDLILRESFTYEPINIQEQYLGNCFQKEGGNAIRGCDDLGHYHRAFLKFLKELGNENIQKVFVSRGVIWRITVEDGKDKITGHNTNQIFIGNKTTIYDPSENVKGKTFVEPTYIKAYRN
jgi:hypothetical protein